MERDIIRLEALKLAVMGDRVLQEVLHRAKAYEDFIVGQKDESSEQTALHKRRGRPRKLGDSDILS